jgi:predicted membrane protein
MSEEGSFGLNLAEKLFGLILVVIGTIGLYYTVASSAVLFSVTGLFAFLLIVLIALGAVLLTAKTE